MPATLFNNFICYCLESHHATAAEAEASTAKTKQKLFNMRRVSAEEWNRLRNVSLVSHLADNEENFADSVDECRRKFNRNPKSRGLFFCMLDKILLELTHNMRRARLSISMPEMARIPFDVRHRSFTNGFLCNCLRLLLLLRRHMYEYLQYIC